MKNQAINDKLADITATFTAICANPNVSVDEAKAQLIEAWATFESALNTADTPEQQREKFASFIETMNAIASNEALSIDEKNARVQEAVLALGSTPTKTEPLRIQAMNRGVFEVAPPLRDWLFTERAEGETTSTGVLPKGRVGMIAAAGGVGKTMCLLQLALSIATGKKWLGHFDIPETSRGDVLIAMGEEDENEVWRRLYQAGRMLDLSEAERELAYKHIHLLPMMGKPCALTEIDKSKNVRATPLLAELKKILEDEKAGRKWQCLIIDPLARFAGEEVETNNTGATRFIQALEELAQVRGKPAVLVAHHTTKVARREGSTDTTISRGASALTDGARWVATLTPHPDSKRNHAVFEVTKSNYSPLSDPILLMRDLKNGGALREPNGDELEEFEHAIEEAKEKEKPKRKGKDRNTPTAANKKTREFKADEPGIGRTLATKANAQGNGA